MLVWDNRTKVFRYVEENVRHDRLGQEARANAWMSRMCHDWQSSPSQSLGHMQEQDARRTEAESILPENKHVWMQGNRINLHQATNVLYQRNGIAHQKNSGEWVKRMRQ